MFSRMSIRAKLFFIVYLMTALVIGIGTWGFYLAYQAGDLLVTVYEDEIRPIRDLQQMSDLLRIDIVNTVEDLYRGELPFREGGEQLRGQIGELRADWVAFQGQKKLEQSEQEATTLARLEASLETIFGHLDELDPMVESRDRMALAEFSEGQLAPALEPYRKATNQLVAQRLRQVERTYGDARKEFVSNLGFVLVVVGVGVLLAVFLCLVITRGINRSLRTVDSKLAELAEGEADLSQRIDVTMKDEIGSLAKNFNRLMGNLEELVQQVKKSGVLVSTSTTDIAAGTKELEATVTEQAASTHEVVASAKEISATSQELLNTMTEVASLSEVTSASASRGRDDLGEIETTMSRIEGAATTVGDHLSAISEKAGKISNVVDTINKVADQTNLLSLNAAIEAEKAGEYGRGFAVVAREIRRLADQTAVATLDIENTVGEMKGAVTSGVDSMERFATQIQEAVATVDTVSHGLGEIIGQIQTLNPQFELVFDGMQTQAQGARQISDSMMVLGEASQQTAENLRDTNEAIARLNEAASGLQKEFARFSVS